MSLKTRMSLNTKIYLNIKMSLNKKNVKLHHMSKHNILLSWLVFDILINLSDLPVVIHHYIFDHRS